MKVKVNELVNVNELKVLDLNFLLFLTLPALKIFIPTSPLAWSKFLLQSRFVEAFF